MWIDISLNFLPKGHINNIPALVQMMAWCWPGDKPFSEPMMVSLFNAFNKNKFGLFQTQLAVDKKLISWKEVNI